MRAGRHPARIQRSTQPDGLLGRQHRAPQEQVDQHQVDVELEFVGLAQRRQRAVDRPQLERLDLAVRGVGHEILRQPQVVADQPVAPQPLGPLHRVADDARPARPWPPGPRGSPASSSASFTSVCAGRHAGRHAAGDDVVELAGIERLVGGPPRRPTAAAPSARCTRPFTCTPVGRDAERRQRAAVDPAPAPGRRDRYRRARRTPRPASRPNPGSATAAAIGSSAAGSSSATPSGAAADRRRSRRTRGQLRQHPADRARRRSGTAAAARAGRRCCRHGCGAWKRLSIDRRLVVRPVARSAPFQSLVGMPHAPHGCVAVPNAQCRRPVLPSRSRLHLADHRLAAARICGRRTTRGLRVRVVLAMACLVPAKVATVYVPIIYSRVGRRPRAEGRRPGAGAARGPDRRLRAAAHRLLRLRRAARRGVRRRAAAHQPRGGAADLPAPARAVAALPSRPPDRRPVARHRARHRGHPVGAAPGGVQHHADASSRC